MFCLKTAKHKKTTTNDRSFLISICKLKQTSELPLAEIIYIWKIFSVHLVYIFIKFLGNDFKEI